MATRRDILRRVAAISGTAGAYAAAQALGLLEGQDAWAGAPALQPGSGAGARVVILGAGVGGMSAAYELGRAGYACTVLEARGRTGGRNLTLRRGDVVEMNDGARQTCAFDEGYYFNAGPARIPSHHQATLGYTREFGVPMETLVNHSQSALLQAPDLNGGKPITMRQAEFDLRGQLSELMVKAVHNGGLNQAMSADDRGRLEEFVGNWGALAKADASGLRRYLGTDGAGYVQDPGAGDQVGKAGDPLPLSTLMHPLVSLGGRFHEVIDMQATMMQPVGGMDAIPRAFEAKLGAVIRKGCEVTAIRRRGVGVEVTYLDRASGQRRAIEADYCLVTIPLKVLADIPSDFSADRKAAIKRALYGDGIKIAFQAPRFWEREAQIYGGLSFTDRDTNITWYPSAGFGTAEGVLVAGYSFGDQAARFAALPFAQRYAYARGTVEALHPGHGGDLKAPITVTWSAMPYSLGLGSSMANAAPADYALLGEADGPFYFAGEHLSHVGAWQQGAFVSAHRTVAMLDARHRQGRRIDAARPQ